MKCASSSSLSRARLLSSPRAMTRIPRLSSQHHRTVVRRRQHRAAERVARRRAREPRQRRAVERVALRAVNRTTGEVPERRADRDRRARSWPSQRPATAAILQRRHAAPCAATSRIYVVTAPSLISHSVAAVRSRTATGSSLAPRCLRVVRTSNACAAHRPTDSAPQAAYPIGALLVRRSRSAAFLRRTQRAASTAAVRSQPTRFDSEQASLVKQEKAAEREDQRAPKSRDCRLPLHREKRCWPSPGIRVSESSRSLQRSR